MQDATSNAGYHQMQDSPCRMTDAGYKMQGAGCNSNSWVGIWYLASGILYLVI